MQHHVFPFYCHPLKKLTLFHQCHLNRSRIRSNLVLTESKYKNGNTFKKFIKINKRESNVETEHPPYVGEKLRDTAQCLLFQHLLLKDEYHSFIPNFNLIIDFRRSSIVRYYHFHISKSKCVIALPRVDLLVKKSILYHFSV